MTKKRPLKDSIEIMGNVKRHHSYFANYCYITFLCIGLDADRKLWLEFLCPL